jgi:hypothetical protein
MEGRTFLTVGAQSIRIEFIRDVLVREITDLCSVAIRRSAMMWDHYERVKARMKTLIPRWPECSNACITRSM